MTAGMKYSLIPKRNKKAIYEYLFKEGVIVVQKDAKVPFHPEVGQKENTEEEGGMGGESGMKVPNLHVMMTLKSLESRNYVDEKFNWQHHYYFLTNEGIEYLREYLHLPASVFPATLTKKAPGRGGQGGDRGGRGERGGADGDDNWRPRRGFGRGAGPM